MDALEMLTMSIIHMACPGQHDLLVAVRPVGLLLPPGSRTRGPLAPPCLSSNLVAPARLDWRWAGPGPGSLLRSLEC
jgi:hypothetical protein